MLNHGSRVSEATRFLSMLSAVVLLGPDFPASQPLQGLCPLCVSPPLSKRDNKTHERDAQWVGLPAASKAHLLLDDDPTIKSLAVRISSLGHVNLSLPLSPSVLQLHITHLWYAPVLHLCYCAQAHWPCAL